MRDRRRLVGLGVWSHPDAGFMRERRHAVEIALERVEVDHQGGGVDGVDGIRSEEHTSELQSLMRISYAVFCLKKKIKKHTEHHNTSTDTIYTCHTMNTTNEL